MELLFKPSDIITSEKLKTWNKKALMEYHTYADKGVDRPFLTPDSVLQEKNS